MREHLRAVDKHQGVLQLSAVCDEVMREGPASGPDIHDCLGVARKRRELPKNVGQDARIKGQPSRIWHPDLFVR
jgi:hypothetical protein